MFKKKLGFLLGVMVFLSLAGYIICLLAGGTKQIKKENEFLLVTSFYPMYVLAENLTEGVEGITVSNLTENQTGCLHDYQLTSRDMKLLSGADAFLINGAGMELFMEKVIGNNGDLAVIEASHGITLLEGVEHNHAHGEAEPEHAEHEHEEHEHEEHEHEEHEHEEHEHDEEVIHKEEGHAGHSHAQNGHVWMNVENYRLQAAMVKEELQKLLPEQKEALESAAAVYDTKLCELLEEIDRLSGKTKGIPVVIFHEAFAYLADSLGMEVLMSLALDEETVPSAGEIAEVIEEIKYHGTALIMIEEQYAEYVDKILAETAAKVVYLDPLTVGDGAADSYVSGMRQNLETIWSKVE